MSMEKRWEALKQLQHMSCFECKNSAGYLYQKITSKGKFQERLILWALLI